MSDWKTFLEEGRQFHRTAKGSVKRPDIFTPVIVQNIAAMAIEKYFMALFLKRGVMPLNHTILDLCSSAVTLLKLPPHLLKVLAEMDGVQQICSLEHFKITPPSSDDVLRFLNALDETAMIVLKELNVCENETTHAL
ncbi:MAG: hypothetical protein LBN39_00040 [Planctomycetaceae bacterium]|jgi:acetoacetate decarboxylase|nr:hypothetical protein [Planctomycetaceae bacterium]